MNTEVSKGSFLKTIFDDLSVGKIQFPLLNLIRPSHQEAHNHHVNHITADIEQVDHVFGAVIRTRSSIYRPHPASSTLFLLRAVFSLPYRKVARILDMGTGSGAIAISLLQNGYAEKALLTDINSVAIEVARKNIVDNKLGSSAAVLESDLFSAVKETEKFDRIFFSAPFWHKPAEETRAEELALVDVDGKVMQTFLNQADKYLKPDGEIIFAYSNLCYPEILNAASAKWKFELILGEYAPDIGLFKFIFKGRKR